MIAALVNEPELLVLDEPTNHLDLAGDEVGTLFHPTGKRRPTRLLWLAHATEPKGVILLDPGAVRAVVERRASLLAAGITGVTGSFRLTVRKDMELNWPFAESATHLMSIGLDEDLDDAAKQAVREMVKHVCARTNLTRNEAYMLCSLAGNLRVTQLVDGNKGIHMLLPKACL